MDENLTRKIDEARSILIVVPSDIDVAAAYYALAIASACQDKFVTLVSDGINKVRSLAIQAAQLNINPMTTKAIRSYVLTLKKSSNTINDVYIDETPERLSLSFRSAQIGLDLTQILDLKAPKIDQDLLIVVQSNNYTPSKKYRQIIESFTPEKRNTLVAETSQDSEIFGRRVLNIVKNIKAEITNSEIYNSLLMGVITQSHNFFQQSREALTHANELLLNGANYQTVASRLNTINSTEEVLFLNLIQTNIHELSSNIYLSQIDETSDRVGLTLSSMTHIVIPEHCNTLIILLSGIKGNRIFVINLNNSISFSGLIKKYNAVGDNHMFYFASKANRNDLLNELSQHMINPYELHEMTKAEIELMPLEAPRFTQGLNPITEPLPLPVIEEKKAVLEEC
jgi:hypothetical protein